MFGYHVSDLQTNVRLVNNRFYGTLKYLDDGALVDRWGAGNFIAVNLADNDFTGLTSVKIGMDPSESSGLVELIEDPDKNGAFKVTNKNGQKFVVEISDGTHTQRQEFVLANLKVQSE